MAETGASTVSAHTLLTQAQSLLAAQNWPALRQHLIPHREALQQVAPGCFMLGMLHIGEGDYGEALRLMQRCLSLDETYHEARYYIGDILRTQHQHHAALPFLNELVKNRPEHAMGWLALGRCLYHADRIDLALSALQQARRLDANLPELDTHLATAYQAYGEHDKAREAIAAALRRDPDNPIIMYNYISIHDASVSDDEWQRFLAAYEALPESHEQRGALAIALARVCEKRKDHEQAFDWYETANHAYAQHAQEATSEEAAFVAQIREHTDGWQHFEGYGLHERGPVFIVGMPRSGTTLIEQIIAAHSQVTQAGELQLLLHLSRRMMPLMTGKPYPEALAHVTPEQSEQLGRAYLDALRRYGDQPLLIDKMPGNWIHIPLIRLILPQAIVIHARRDPIDTCWSIWRQHFTHGHHYRHRFDTLARAYRLYETSMKAWHAQFPGFIHTVRYEELVADPEAGTRRLITDICGLNWESQCLAFHQRKQIIRTASIGQANRPIYQSAVKSWQPLAHRLQPLIDALRTEGVEVGI